MKIPTFLPSLVFVAILGLAAVVCAQTPPPANECPCGGPGHNPKLDAAIKACESKLGGSREHPVAYELMVKCMDAKGFKRPPGPSGPPPGLPPGPPPGSDVPPPPASGS